MFYKFVNVCYDFIHKKNLYIIHSSVLKSIGISARQHTFGEGSILNVQMLNFIKFVTQIKNAKIWQRAEIAVKSNVLWCKSRTSH